MKSPAFKKASKSAPLKENLASEVARWPPDLRAEFEERAGIIEFDGKMSRSDAERAAYELLKCKAPLVQQELPTE